jgi:peptide deformylase
VKLPILLYGHPILRKKGEKITEITDEIRQLVSDMIETMDEGGRGIGLAAQQVGRALKLFVLRRYVDGPDGKWTVSDPIVYINPKILAVSKETGIVEEGCLSIPNVLLPVERPVKIKIESTRLDGSKVVEEVEGMNARVILHENDHINGVLFIDRVEEKYVREVEGILRAIKKSRTTSR